MASQPKIDELVQSVTLYVPRPFILNGFVLPFIILYSSWTYIWFFVYGVWDYYEAGIIGVCLIGLCQLFCCLCCHWSVHVRCFFTCNKVIIMFQIKWNIFRRITFKFYLKASNHLSATLAKVVPTSNNGSSELVNLHRTKINNENESESLWFMFQKTKYVWDPDKKNFRGVEFPINYSFGKYMDWKGYQDDDGLLAAEMEYGINT